MFTYAYIATSDFSLIKILHGIEVCFLDVLVFDYFINFVVDYIVCFKVSIFKLP